MPFMPGRPISTRVTSGKSAPIFVKGFFDGAKTSGAAITVGTVYQHSQPSRISRRSSITATLIMTQGEMIQLLTWREALVTNKR